jgi:hypothetical protein
VRAFLDLYVAEKVFHPGISIAQYMHARNCLSITTAATQGRNNHYGILQPRGVQHAEKEIDPAHGVRSGVDSWSNVPQASSPRNSQVACQHQGTTTWCDRRKSPGRQFFRVFLAWTFTGT